MVDYGGASARPRSRSSCSRAAPTHPRPRSGLSQRALDHLSIHAVPILTAHVQDARFPDILGVSAGGLVVDLTDGAHTQMSQLELELVLMEDGAPPDWMRPEAAAAHCPGAALAFRLHAELGLNFAFAARRGGRVGYRGRLQVSVDDRA